MISAPAKRYHMQGHHHIPATEDGDPNRRGLVRCHQREQHLHVLLPPRRVTLLEVGLVRCHHRQQHPHMLLPLRRAPIIEEDPAKCHWGRCYPNTSLLQPPPQEPGGVNNRR